MYSLARSYCTIVYTVTTGILHCYQKQNITADQMELNEFFAGKPFMDVHDDENRGNFIAFSQGAKDRKLQNQALVAFEVSFHGSTKDALLCIKVDNLIYLSVFLQKLNKC